MFTSAVRASLAPFILVLAATVIALSEVTVVGWLDPGGRSGRLGLVLSVAAGSLLVVLAVRFVDRSRPAAMAVLAGLGAAAAILCWYAVQHAILAVPVVLAAAAMAAVAVRAAAVRVGSPAGRALAAAWAAPVGAVVAAGGAVWLARADHPLLPGLVVAAGLGVALGQAAVGRVAYDGANRTADAGWALAAWFVGGVAGLLVATRLAAAATEERLRQGLLARGVRPSLLEVAVNAGDRPALGVAALALLAVALLAAVLIITCRVAAARPLRTSVN